MKKILLALALGCMSLSMTAQRASDANLDGDLRSYNRIGISYNNENYSFNNDYSDESDIDGLSLNGVGIDYIHGFHITESLPLFIETGLNFNLNFGSKTEKDSSEKYEVKSQDYNFQVPVNFVWRFNLGENLHLDPYVGLNFKLHLATKIKESYENEYDSENYDWFSVFDKDDMDGGDYTWNRFQMGWHVGAGITYSSIYFGLQYGTDFISAYSHDFGEGYKPKVSTGNLKVTVAYTF